MSCEFNDTEIIIKDLKSYEYVKQGPILIRADKFKFMDKFLSREEYHRWIDNDLRKFG
jgi:hypothetical protein